MTSMLARRLIQIRRWQLLVFVASLMLLAESSLAQVPRVDVAASQAIQRAAAAHGTRLANGEILDWVSVGKLTYFAGKGAGARTTFDVTLFRKGKSQVQRVVKQQRTEIRHGADGVRSWESVGGFRTVANGQVLDFIESQTVRSIQTLFNYQAEGLSLRDSGKKDKATIVESQDKQGRTTRYFIDDGDSRITRLEFSTTVGKHPKNGKPLTRVDSYVFSEFRPVQGVLTPFKIERYSNSIKTEEMLFTSVRYNTSLRDQVFKP